MNPNQLTRELRNLPGNVHSRSLPGGSIISAVLDRNLMTWSDRGGASRIFGEIWSEHCWAVMGNGSSERRLITGSDGEEFVLRLDANPRIAAQAARNKLANPDFLVLVEEADRRVSVRAVDAKFAFDRLRRVQVSPEAVRDLVELPGSLVRQEIEQRMDSDADQTLRYTSGAFVGPKSLLNDYFYQRMTHGAEPDVPADELQLLTVDASDLFQRTEEHLLMELLESIDGIAPYSVDTGVLFGMYYLRLACAARWFEEQMQAPLLTLEDPEPPPVEQVVDAARRWISPERSAYQVIRRWSRSVDRAIEDQTQVSNAARLPVSMGELRALLERAGLGDDKKRLRMLRGSLERSFMRRLLDEIGEIPAQPREPVSRITQRVGKQSRKLKPEMLRQAGLIVERFADESS